MSEFSFLQNKSFLTNSVATPYLVTKEKFVNVELVSDLTMQVVTADFSINVKESIVKSAILPTLGITGIIKQRMIDGTDPNLTQHVLDMVSPILEQNITNFLFYLDLDGANADAVVVTPLFDKHFEPFTLENNPEVLNGTLCTSHFPVEEGMDYNVIDFDHSTNNKVYHLNLARLQDKNKKLYPIVHNQTSIAWSDKWDQRASIYDVQRDLYLTLPRNYGKGEYKTVDKIFLHVDSIIDRLDLEQDYDKEFNEMLAEKLPKPGVELMMTLDFDNHKLITILDRINSLGDEIKPTVYKALFKCLGYMVAKKIRCCTKCRHLDEEKL